MSGYKRVSFYELCRLCASNSEKEKTHIFQEDGRKIQLQSKIQTCLALTVNENDFLPKVVCSKCLRNLETCFGFQQECVRSESMLSTYFKNFRYTEDFKKSGKVYIKDIKPQPPPAAVQQNPEISTSTNLASNQINNLAATNLNPVTPISTTNANIIAINKSQGQTVEQIPVYTLQLPTIVANPNLGGIKNSKTEVIDNRLTGQVTQNQFAYNLNLINAAAIKTNLPKNEVLSNVVVNANGEVINIAQMGDFETILSQGNVVKNKYKTVKRSKESCPQEEMAKIDLTDSSAVSPVYELEQSPKYEKLPHIKPTQNQSNKYTYSLKIEDKPQTQNPTVIFPLSEYNQSFNNFPNTGTNQSNLNIANNTNNISPNTNVICNSATNVEGSAININLLSQSMQEMTQVGFANVISNVNSNSLNSSSESDDNKMNLQINPVTDNNNTNTNTNSSNGNADSSPVKVHVCEICQRGFKRREHLYQHVKLHTGFRPYICESCSKAFMRKEHLLRHSTLHSGQKNFTCNICEKSFSRNDNLLKHKKTHEKQASYVCEICQKHFVMKHYYNAHKLTHGDKCYVTSVWGMLKT